MKLVLVVAVVGLLFSDWVRFCGCLLSGHDIGGKILPVPADPNTRPTDLLFREFAAYIHRALQDKGFTPADVNDTEQIILLEYGIGPLDPI